MRYKSLWAAEKRGGGCQSCPLDVVVVMNPVLLTMNTVPCCRAEKRLPQRGNWEKTKQSLSAQVRRGSSSYLLSFLFSSLRPIICVCVGRWTRTITAIQLVSWPLRAACGRTTRWDPELPKWCQSPTWSVFRVNEKERRERVATRGRSEAAKTERCCAPTD